MPKGKFELKFDPRTIEHLGVKMYSTLPPALSELVSNAYDADASEVKVLFYETKSAPKSITVIDNGHGMSAFDIQNRFLVIGRNRRTTDGDLPSPLFRRLPTGKKGLGKLALFGLAKKISVDTVKDGYRNRFVLSWDDLITAEGTYNPVMEIDNQKTSNNNGTIIKLQDLKRKSGFDVDSLADSLSRIFIVDNNFTVKLENVASKKKAKIENARRFRGVEKEFSWTIKDVEREDDSFFGEVNGTFITSKTPIPPSSGLRGITIFSRGKLVNAPEFFSSSTSSHFYQYLTGWVEADFIDLLDEDVISTNRQSINWDHPTMSDFREYLASLMSRLNRSWRDKRRERKERFFRQETGIDQEAWLSSMPSEIRESAESIIRTLSDDEGVSESFLPVIEAVHSMVPEYPMLHWRHLASSVRDRVAPYYKNGQYALAADQAAKIYAKIIRDKVGEDVDGTHLASFFQGKNLDPKIKVADLSTESGRNIQDGQGHLTRGVMAGFRNPISHAPVDEIVPALFSELDCLNILSLVSYLVGRVENYDQ